MLTARLVRAARITALAASAVIIIYPIAWLILSSFKPVSAILSSSGAGVFDRLTTANYALLFHDARFWRFFLNSTVVAVVSTAVAVGVAVFGAYSLARTRFWGVEAVGGLVFFVYMVPKVLVAIPLYVWMFQLGLLNSYAGLILVHIAEGIPFALWMMRAFFMAIPHSLEEAAMIDGATRLGALLRVILPIAGPGIVTVAMFTFITSWNDFLFAFMLINKTDYQTLSVGLAYLFASGDTTNFGGLMAGAVITSIPVFALFLLLHRHLVNGTAAGAVKG